MFGLNKKKETFKFYVPISYETFEKSESGADDSKYLIKVKGIASSKTEDTDGETLDPAGFVVKKGSLINWNHQATKTSSAICGKLLYSSVINGGQDFYVEGGIYNNTEGRAVAELLDTVKGDPDIVIGWSIEGKVVEKNPLDTKKITKAVIMGIALTHIPKNGNTWVDIVKGQYNDLDPKESEEDLEEDGEEKEIEKMDTGNTSILMKESVEHSSPAKPGGIKNLVALTKSQVYEQIISKYSLDINNNLDITKNIYNFVKSLNDKLMENKEIITEDTLTKAFEILDGITKGEEVTTLETTNEVVPEETIVDEADVVKSERYEFAKSLCLEGLSKEVCIENMIRKGYGYSDSLTDVEKAIVETPAKEAATTGEIVKAADVAKLVLNDISKSLEDTIGKSFNPLNDKISKGFGVVSELLKSQGKENELLKSELSELTKRLDKVENTPMPSKTVRNVSGIDKFAKSEDADSKLPEGFREVSVNDPMEKSIILSELETNFDLSKSEGEKRIWGDAMSKVEIAGLAHLDPNLAKRLKVSLVN